VAAVPAAEIEDAVSFTKAEQRRDGVGLERGEARGEEILDRAEVELAVVRVGPVPPGGQKRPTSRYVPNTLRNTSEISPSVA
jgi:hypothetical protein